MHEAVRHLHEGGFVHGDLRRPNVLVAAGKDDTEVKVWIIDFDWAGRCGHARYAWNRNKRAVASRIALTRFSHERA